MNKDDTKKEMFSWVQELDDNFMGTRGALKVKRARIFLNKRMFRVADTFLTYRQINFLATEGLLKDNRKEKSNWREFSLKELVYLSLVKELRAYGIANKQLTTLKEIFFSQRYASNVEENLLMALKGKKIVLVFKNKDKASFYNLPNYVVFCRKLKSHININLNEIIFEILDLLKKKRIDYKDELYFVLKTVETNKKEEQLLKFIRNKDYKSITIRNSKNKEYLIQGERTEIIDEKELIIMIKLLLEM